MENTTTLLKKNQIQKKQLKQLKGKKQQKRKRKQDPENRFLVDLKISKNKFNTLFKVYVPSGEEIKKEYEEYIKELKKKYVLFSDTEDPKRAKAINAYYKSRYSPQGLAGIAKKIREGVNYHVEKGVFVTLTYAHILSLDEAWAALDSDISRITNSIKVFAKREAKRRHKPVPDLQYMYVVEAQESGYPHLHIFYADIDRLMDKDDLRWLWGRGHVKVKKRANVNLGKYMSKYLTKQSTGKEKDRIQMVLPYVWKYRIRLYGSSQKFHPKRSVEEKRWKLIGFCTYRYEGNPNVPDLITLAQSNNVEVIEFAWRGGGITLEKGGEKYVPFRL